MKFKFFFTTLSFCFASVSAWAQDTLKNPLLMNGTVDAYYRYASDEAPSLTAYNRAANGFALGMADINISKTVGKAGFSASLSFGERAELIGYNVFGKGSLAALRQVFVFYKPSEKLKLTLGSFNTHVGYEQNEPTNKNYSLSYLFTNSPYFHTGAKAEYTFSSEFSGMIGVFDDNDSKTDAVKGKHVGAQLAYQKGKIKAFLNFLRGRDLDSLTGQQFDLIVNYQLTPKFTLVLNASQKQFAKKKKTETAPSENKNWSGAVIYATYSVNERLSISARYDFFADSDASLYGISDLKINATTLSLNYKINDLTLIPELRFDSANSNLFGVEKDQKSVVSLLFATVYKF